MRKSKVLTDVGWLFPGQNPVNPLSARQLSRAILAAAAEAEIDKCLSIHILRHSFAPQLLEQKVGIRLIQVLLDHGLDRVCAKDMKRARLHFLYAQHATQLGSFVDSTGPGPSSPLYIWLCGYPDP